MSKINTHKSRIMFGKHGPSPDNPRGTFLTRVPPGYLSWAVNTNCDGPVKLESGDVVPAFLAAKAELQRRGERLQTLELSAHAVDRFSLRYWRLFQDERKKDEGLFSFMERLLDQAIGLVQEDDRKGVVNVDLLGVRWIINFDMVIPVLLSVKPRKEKKCPTEKKEN